MPQYGPHVWPTLPGGLGAEVAAQSTPDGSAHLYGSSGARARRVRRRPELRDVASLFARPPRLSGLGPVLRWRRSRARKRARARASRRRRRRRSRSGRARSASWRSASPSSSATRSHRRILLGAALGGLAILMLSGAGETEMQHDERFDATFFFGWLARRSSSRRDLTWTLSSSPTSARRSSSRSSAPSSRRSSSAASCTGSADGLGLPVATCLVFGPRHRSRRLPGARRGRPLLDGLRRVGPQHCRRDRPLEDAPRLPDADGRRRDDVDAHRRRRRVLLDLRLVSECRALYGAASLEELKVADLRHHADSKFIGVALVGVRLDRGS